MIRSTRTRAVSEVCAAGSAITRLSIPSTTRLVESPHSLEQQHFRARLDGFLRRRHARVDGELALGNADDGVESVLSLELLPGGVHDPAVLEEDGALYSIR